jgi:NADPH:quinone reductase-like Zn-dependent oxidoreductase
MKTIQLRDSFGIDNLHLVEQPQPSPAPGEIRVRMEATALNYVDLLVVKGQLNPHLRLPYIPVADGAGTIDSVGEGVTEFASGDRVATTFVSNWVNGDPTPETTDDSTRPGLGTIPGQLSEYKIFRPHQLIKSPANLSAIEAATLPIAGLTAWNALRYGNIQAGDTVLLHGTGGVSIFALQFAKAHGARVIITSSSDTKLERTRQLGADLTINYKTTPDWAAKVQALTDGGADLVVETVGGENLQKSINALRMGGHISIMAVMSEFSELHTLEFLTKQATIKAMEVGSTRDFEAMNLAIVVNNIHPVIDKKFSFDRTQAAFEYLAGGAHLGKVVITDEHL